MTPVTKTVTHYDNSFGILRHASLILTTKLIKVQPISVFLSDFAVQLLLMRDQILQKADSAIMGKTRDLPHDEANNFMIRLRIVE